ncbi:hypothetical protein M422DRAFT_253965 [Sphaerobolus stellatus SS14]|uniref:Uncharacterized protein n=1 Tax=Sphaerobolus stellatus (strain SS14) TaxID=990650 RepID=A0A0C9VM33_SPHS4|nr:hypothetical protein M422DRAFT_253965 [Sphaerobolus stellatus SS14]
MQQSMNLPHPLYTPESVPYVWVEPQGPHDACLPQFKFYNRNHPQWKDKHAFVYEWDPEKGRDLGFLEFVKARHTPGFFKAEACGNGEMEIVPEADKTTRDVIQVFVTGKGIIDLSFWNELMELREAILGPASLHGPTFKLDENKRAVSGYTAFERISRAAHSSAARAYNYFGPAYQQPAEAFTLNKSSHMSDSAEHNFCQHIFKTMCQLGKCCMEQAPQVFQEVLKKHAALTGMPSFGVNNNPFFTAAQLNLSQSVEHAQLALDLTITELKKFGELHIDSRDAFSHLSLLTCLSELPERYHPGLLFLWELGCLYTSMLVDLLPSLGFMYMGQLLQVHLLAPPGEPLSPAAVRATHVLFPQAAMVHMNGSMALAALPGKGVKVNRTLEITPEHHEFLVPEEDNCRCSNLTFTQDGAGMLPRKEHVDLVGRNLLELSQYIVAQFPEKYCAHINPELFMQAIEYCPESSTSCEERTHASLWQYGECVAHLSEKARQDREKEWAVVDEYFEYAHKCIPFMLLRESQGHGTHANTWESLVTSCNEVHLEIFDREAEQDANLQPKHKKEGQLIIVSENGKQPRTCSSGAITADQEPDW